MSEFATNFNCDHCENSFSKEKHLRKHYKKSHFRLFSQKFDSSPENEEKYECMDCGKKFKKRRHLNQHTEEHIDAYENESINTEADEAENGTDANERDSTLEENVATICNREGTQSINDELQIAHKIQKAKDDTPEDNNTAKTEAVHDFNSLNIKQEKSIVIDDAAFEQLENDLSAMITDEIEAYLEESDESFKIKEQEASPPKKRRSTRSNSYDEETAEEHKLERTQTESEFENSNVKIESESPISRRSTRTPISYNEDWDSEGEKPKSKPSSKGKSKEKKIKIEVEPESNRRSRRTPVSYIEDSDSEGSELSISSAKRKSSISNAEKRRRVQDNDNRPENARRSRRSNVSISYYENGEDQITRRQARRKRDSDTDFVLDGEPEIETMEDNDCYSHLMVNEEEILDRVEITPMTEEFTEGFLPNTTTKISIVDDINIHEVSTRSKAKKYKCKHCPESFNIELKLNLHSKLKHNSVKNNNNPKANKNNKSNIKNVDVRLQNIGNTKKKSLEPTKKDQRRTSTPPPVFTCGIKRCREKFSQKKSLDQHREDTHFYKCTKCVGTIIFETQSAFTSHDSKYHVKPCDECDKVFDSDQKLSNHKETVHPHCSVCEDEFSWPSPGHSCFLTKQKSRR